MDIQKEIDRRRTFAIISHPDAGKTTLTEKFLLYGGALHLAGSVKARKNQRASTSDWMELEKQRGISVSSTVLQFEYEGFHVNLLDTPGHKDFSEDTYRVLTAVDAAVMVIDAGKGVESQTKKLFEVCSRRGVPIFTFINKVDRPTKDCLSLLDELEKVLGLEVCPVNWPLGTGPDFKGVYDLRGSKAHFFERTPGGAFRAPESIQNLSDPMVKDKLPDDIFSKTLEEIEMVEMVGADLDEQKILDGKMTPVFFGSAINNFGVQLLLDYFLKLSCPPRARKAGIGVIEPDFEKFSGFVFKIQANMDPKHRDRIAFIRVCSGKFSRDMSVFHPRSGKTVRLSNSTKLFAQDRETVDEAYAGDVLGLVGHSDFTIGDTVTEDKKIIYNAIPRFTPEVFAFLRNPSTAQYKRFRTGLDQLLQEGVVQALDLRDSLQKVPLLAAVGPLQFEVVQHRLKNEYNAESRLESASWSAMRWINPEIPSEDLQNLLMPTGSRIAYDKQEQPVILFTDEWSIDYFLDKNKEFFSKFLETQKDQEIECDEKFLSLLPFGEELTVES